MLYVEGPAWVMFHWTVVIHYVILLIELMGHLIFPLNDLVMFPLIELVDHLMFLLIELVGY